ncbi:MAG TPA: PKD domain-containing protein, partial [Cytophagaceae bacterium]
MRVYNILVIFIVLLVLSVQRAYAQCPHPELYDLTFIHTSSTPYWEHCIDNASDPDTFSLELISPDDINNYTIDFGDGTSTSGVLWEANTPIVHKYGLGKYIISLTETENGCTTTITGTLVNDRKAGAAAEPPTLGSSGCVPKSLTFRNISTNPSPFTVFEWDWGDGTKNLMPPTSIGQSITHTYQPGTSGCGMVVTLKAYSLCDTTFSTYGPYNFWDLDTAAVDASATSLCVGDTVTFTDATVYNCNITQPRRIKWDFSELGGPVTPWLPTTPANRTQKFFVSGPPGSEYTVYLLDSNFCGIDRGAVTVRIVAPPVALAETVFDPVCVGQPAMFNNNSTGGATEYLWNFGDGTGWTSVSSTVSQTHIYNAPGTYTVTLVASVGGSLHCADTTTTTITVLPIPVVDFTLSMPHACGNVSVTFSNTTAGGDNFEWDFGNGVTRSGEGPFVIDYEPGTYQVTLTVGNALDCKAIKTHTFSIYPGLDIAAEFDSVCLGNATSFKNLTSLSYGSVCARGSILRQQWDDVPGSTVANLTGNPNYPDNPSSSSLLTIFESPSNVGLNYGARIIGFICPPVTGNYTFWIASNDFSELYLSTDANPANKELIAKVDGFSNPREWNKFPEQQSELIYLEADKKYYIEAIHKQGLASDHLSVGWRLPNGVYERPIPGNRLSPYEEGNFIQSWHWDFGDAIGTSTLQDPSYIYTVPGTYKVKLTASTSQCSATDSFDVVVNSLPKADFTYDSVGCSPLDPNIVNTSSNANSYIWNFGDGSPVSTEANPIHLYYNSTKVVQTHSLTLIARTVHGCTDTISRPVTINPGLDLNFTFSPSTPVCSPANISFSTQIVPENTYTWIFAGSDTIVSALTTVDYLFENNTAFVRQDTVTLLVQAGTGCKGEISKTVIVYPKPELDLIALPDSGCHPLNVQFSVEGNVAAYHWTFGDGGVSTNANPMHTYLNTSDHDSTFTVSLIAVTPFLCRDTLHKTIVVHPKPAASVNVIGNNTGCSPLEVAFENISINATSFYWDFKDGITMDTNAAIVHHTFINSTSENKSYLVELEASNQYGCTDKAS